MVSILAQQLLGFLVLSNLALAVRFQFGIEEVTVGTTRDNFEDDGLLVVASYTGSGNKSNDWELGSLEEGDSIKWTNLTQEIDVPSGASNLSVAIGVSNAKDADEELVSKFVQGIVTVAAAVPGPQAPAARLIGLALSLIGDPFNCTGPVAVSNVIYTQDTLDKMDQNQKDCDQQTYSYETPLTCGLDNSSYTVKWCIERLDPKTSAAASLALSSSLSFAVLSVALFFGIHGLLM